MKNVHLVGCPRSGTTLLTEMMGASFRLEANWRHEESIFSVPCKGHTVYLSKKPNDVVWMSRLLDGDPSLFVIAMLRDPRSVVTSIHKGNPGLYFCNYPVWKRAERALTEIADKPRVLTVRYEDLVENPDRVQEQIAGFLPFLQVRSSFTEFYRHAHSSRESQLALGGVRKADPGRITGWKEHRSRLKQQVLRHPGLLQDLIRHGYEEDDSWLALLEHVEAQKFPCRYSDKRRLLKEIEQKIRINRKIRIYLDQVRKDKAA